MRHEGEAVGAVRLDAVGVAIGIEGLDRRGGECSIVVDAVDCDLAAAVVGGQQVGDGVVGGQVGRAFFLRDLADRGELSAAAIDGVALDAVARERSIALGLKRAQEFSWHRTGAATAAFLRKVALVSE